MKVRVDERFLAEAARFDLRATCDTCAHHVRHLGTCAHGWPDQDHRRLPVIAAGRTAEISFCKEFELE